MLYIIYPYIIFTIVERMIASYQRNAHQVVRHYYE